MDKLPREPDGRKGAAGNHARDTQSFCKDCGTALHGAKFCPECGTVTDNARLDAERPPAQRPQPGRAPGWRWLVAGGIGVLVVIALIAALILVRRGSTTGASYLPHARQVVRPVVEENRRLASTLNSLSPGGSASSAKTSVEVAIGATRSAQRTLGTLSPGAANRPFAASVKAALASELSWLTAAATVLGNARSPMLTQLASLGADTQAKLQALDSRIPGASSSFPGSARLISYAHAKNQAASTQTALRQFSGQVQALLTQSGPAFRQINHLFAEMQTAASGGTPTISLAEAETILTGVISNRTALAASARTLNAPTPLAASVRAALVSAMDASLTNDRDISTCLNQANSGTVAFIFQSCLSSTATDSNAATSAKQQFLSLYNELRHQIGQPATGTQF